MSNTGQLDAFSPVQTHKTKLAAKSMNQRVPGSGQSFNRSAPELARGDEIENDHNGDVTLTYSDNSRSVG